MERRLMFGRLANALLDRFEMWLDENWSPELRNDRGDPPGWGLEASDEEARAWAEARTRAGHPDITHTDRNNTTNWDR
jgi:hypothetical protein